MENDLVLRVELMAMGRPPWSMLTLEDRKALKFVLDERREMQAELEKLKSAAPPKKKGITIDPADLPAPERWREAVEQCTTILEMVDELPGPGEDFGMSVAEKVYDIKDWVENNRHVTDAQQEALDNMQSGVSRWLER